MRLFSEPEGRLDPLGSFFLPIAPVNDDTRLIFADQVFKEVLAEISPG